MIVLGFCVARVGNRKGIDEKLQRIVRGQALLVGDPPLIVRVIRHAERDCGNKDRERGQQHQRALVPHGIAADQRVQRQPGQPRNQLQDREPPAVLPASKIRSDRFGRNLGKQAVRPEMIAKRGRKTFVVVARKRLAIGN